MIYGYMTDSYKLSKDETFKTIKDYSVKSGLNMEKVFEDVTSTKNNWQSRVIKDLIDKSKPGDIIIVYDAPSLARSISQVLEIFDCLLSKSINIHFVKYNLVFEPSSKLMTKDLIDLLRQIETDYVTRRTTDAIERRRAAGLPLGRPKGRPNKQLKLDKYRKEIQHYMDLNVSKASIAKLIGCHAQTLYNYVAHRQLTPKKSDGKSPASIDAKVKVREIA